MFAAFAVVTGLLACTSIAALYETSSAQSHVGALVDDALASVQLVTRMAGDIYQRRLLVEAHILESTAADRARIESQIAGIAADYGTARSEYGRHVTFPGERQVWDRLQTDMAATEPGIIEAMRFSSVNQDSSARAVLRSMESRFAAVDRDLSSLGRINEEGVQAALAKVQRLQRSSFWIFAALLLSGVVMTFAVGMRTARLVREREEQAAGYRAMLEVRNRELDAFAGRVAHDLRGPLTTISMAASIVGERAPAVAGTVATQRRAVTHMEGLIQDLLSLSRIDAGVRDGVCEPARLSAELRDELAPRLSAEAVTLRVAVEPATVRCSEGLLRQALSNLADNAIKYRRQDVKPVVEIAGRSTPLGYKLRVSDNGTGMSPEEARQAFEPFWRALRVRDQPGTGLGLSIVKRVAEASGGSVAVDSQLGKGTTFTITLPLAAELTLSR